VNVHKNLNQTLNENNLKWICRVRSFISSVMSLTAAG
jgi:hypothetical protein